MFFYIYEVNYDAQTLFYSISFKANGILPPHLFTSSTGQAHLIPVSNIQFTLKWKNFKMTICYIASAAYLIDSFFHNTVIL